MARLSSITHALRRWLDKPLDELTQLQRSLRYGVDFARYCASELHADRATQMAAALTYHTLFSLLPTLVLMLVVMQSFVGPEELEKFKNQAVDGAMILLQGAAQDPAPPIDVAPTSAPVTADAPASSGTENFGQVARNLEHILQEQINKLQQVNFKSIGTVGVLLFIWGATGLLRTVENSFNLIYAAPSSRQWYVKLPLYYTVITLGPIVLLAGQFVQVQFLHFIQEGALTGWAAGPMVVLSPLLSMWVVLTLMYMLLPNTKVNIGAAAVGGLVAASGWVVAVSLFSIYVNGAASKTLYGALALLPLFLLGLWLTWLIVLFGLEVTYTIQSMPGRRFQRLDKDTHRDTFVDPQSIIPMMGLIARAFKLGQTLDDEQLASQMKLPIYAVTHMGAKLRDAGLLNRVETADQAQTAYALSRPPSQIVVADLIALSHNMRPLNPDSDSIPGQNLLKQLNEAQQKAAQQQTLDEIESTG